MIRDVYAGSMGQKNTEFRLCNTCIYILLRPGRRIGFCMDRYGSGFSISIGFIVEAGSSGSE
jgi:hypothetical protein